MFKIESFSESKWLDQLLPVSIFFIALMIGFYRLNIMGFDYYGDSYHHWLISYLTAKNHYVYTDFKPDTMNIVWLPLFHYFAAFTMELTRIFDIILLRIINIILGSLTCYFIYRIVSVKGVRWIAFISGLSIAVQPWFISINTLVLTETLCCLLIIAALYYYHFNMIYTTIFVGLAMLTRYEGWLFAILIFIVAIIHKRFDRRTVLIYLLTSLAIVCLWSGWSYIQTGNPLTWYMYQRQFLRWDYSFFHSQLSINPDRLLTYPRLINETTSKLFPLAIASAIISFRKSKLIQIITVIVLAYMLFLSFQHVYGFALFDVRHLIYLLPMTSILLYKPFTYFNFKRSRTLYIKWKLPLLSFGFILLILALIPLFFQSNVITHRMELKGEAKAGIFLDNAYEDGYIICDSPTVIYYSKVEPEKFLSSMTLRWYMGNWDKWALKTWLEENNIRYVVWENTSYTELGYLFPELSSGNEITFNSITFQPLFKTDYGYSMIIVYKIVFSSGESF